MDAIGAAIINPDGFTCGYPALVTASAAWNFRRSSAHLQSGAACIPMCSPRARRSRRVRHRGLRSGPARIESAADEV